MSDEIGLTARQAELMAELREHKADRPDSWYLFVNGGFKFEDAKALHDRGLIDGSFQMGMPAIKLRDEAKAEPTDAARILSLTKEVERLRAALESAERFIERTSGGGETDFRATLRAALTHPTDQEGETL